MIKHFLCKVIGDGTSLQNAYRAEIYDHLPKKPGTNAIKEGGHSAVIPTDKITGKPTSKWCFVVVDASPAVLDELENVHRLPRVIPGNANKIRAYLAPYGITDPPPDAQGICDLLEPGRDVTQCRINGKHTDA